MSAVSPAFCEFQFTHPGKGATRSILRISRSVISFNSRTLGRVRLSTFALRPSFGVFQFTHPGKGATEEEDDRLIHMLVSIHAPWEGCDVFGVRRCLSCHKFQFTHPGKGATTERQAGDTIYKTFQFTHPGKGATLRSFSSFTMELLFQFTHPGKGATKRVTILLMRVIVSIHAPWEGCDGLPQSYQARGSRFNSRTLGRVRHVERLLEAVRQAFQFTHPGKGATSPRFSTSRPT